MPLDFSVFQKDFLYSGFTEKDWTILSDFLEKIRIQTGSNVFKENEQGDGFYWIQSGKIRMRRKVIPTVKKMPLDQLLTSLTAGSLFGEIALADKPGWSTDALADDDTVLYHLSRANYEKLQKEHMHTALRIQDVLAKSLCARIRTANRSYEVIYFLYT